MKEFVKIRATTILEQDELVNLLESQLPSSTKQVGVLGDVGLKTVEVRVPLNSPQLTEIRKLIVKRRGEAVHEYTDFTIGSYLRRYTAAELRNAEVLNLSIEARFEPTGDECGTIYETLCPYCNMGRQESGLILDLRRVPRNKDICETISGVEWVVSSKFARLFKDESLDGAEFKPIFELKNPLKRSQDWHQLQIIGGVGPIAEGTMLGKDPFSPSEIEWRCPLGHSVAAQILSEIYLKRDAWDGSDIAITTSLFGQGRNLLRPTPLIVISQRMYRVLQEAGIKGYSVEVAHLI